MRHAPAFWWRRDRTWPARLLAPAGWIYGAVTARRMAQPGTRLPAPVICIGNPVAGGAGKTPTALTVGRLLLERGFGPAYLSRGYGGTGEPGTAVIRVDPARHAPAQTGDEPLLLAAVAPTYVARDRIAAARRALAEGANVLILDDGLQNPSLAKSVAVAVVDGATGVGNGACLPAGPLRAPLARQWPHVSAVCVIGPGAAGEAVAREARRCGLPVWTARLVAEPAAVTRLAGRPLLAFAGIGTPAKFFATLRDNGLDFSHTESFPDHHRFGAADCTALLQRAARSGATLVTTAKDRVRLPADFPAEVLPVSLVFDDPAEVMRHMTSALASVPPSSWRDPVA